MSQNNLFKAIYATHPNVVLIRSDDNGIVTAYDANNNEVAYDEVAVQTYLNDHAYIAKRYNEYPAIGDQLDALFHAGVFPEDMAAKIQAVKDKYPKGGA
jgi:hypothetical protein